MMKKSIGIVLYLAICMTVWVSIPVQAAAKNGNPFTNLDLTTDQVAAIEKVTDEFQPKQMDLLANIQLSMTKFENEIMREGRMETDAAAKKSAKNFNTLFKEISDQTGDLLKLRMAYLLKAKNILTREQRRKLLANLNFEIDIPENLDYFEEVDILDAEIGLTPDQEKKILKCRADSAIKKIQIGLDIDYKVIDLAEELIKEKPDSSKADQIVMDLTNLGVKMLDNYVKTFLKTKDVLTVTQKKEIVQMIMMAQ